MTPVRMRAQKSWWHAAFSTSSYFKSSGHSSTILYFFPNPISPLKNQINKKKSSKRHDCPPPLPPYLIHNTIATWGSDSQNCHIHQSQTQTLGEKRSFILPPPRWRFHFLLFYFHLYPWLWQHRWLLQSSTVMLKSGREGDCSGKMIVREGSDATVTYIKATSAHVTAFIGEGDSSVKIVFAVISETTVDGMVIQIICQWQVIVVKREEFQSEGLSNPGHHSVSMCLVSKLERKQVFFPLQQEFFVFLRKHFRL